MFEECVRKFIEERNLAYMDCKAALIDMDGVLYDSMPNHTEAWYRTISAIGIACRREEFYLYEGMTRRQSINLLFNRAYGHDAPEDVSVQLYNEKVRQFGMLPPPRRMPGAAEMLGVLMRRKIRPVLVTGSSQHTLLEKLQHDYPGVFVQPYCITGEDVVNGKPDPEPYLRGLERAGVAANEAIVIENAPLGVEAGNAAGVFTIAVNTGPIAAEELYKAGARIVFDSMPDFAARIDQLLDAIAQTRKPCTDPSYSPTTPTAQ